MMYCPNCGTELCETDFDSDYNGVYFHENTTYACPKCEKIYEEITNYNLVFANKKFEEV